MGSLTAFGNQAVIMFLKGKYLEPICNDDVMNIFVQYCNQTDVYTINKLI